MIFATEETIVKECPLGFFKLRMRGRDDVLAFNHLVFGLNFPIITDTFKCGGLTFVRDRSEPLTIWERPAPAGPVTVL